jgi:hypothetical protein
MINGYVEITFTPLVDPNHVMALAQQAARALWPEKMGVGLRAVAPLIASVAREVNARRAKCRCRIVRIGDRQRIEPVLEAPPQDGLWPAEGEVVATERHRIGDG